MALALVGQLYVIAAEYVIPWSVRIWRIRDLAAWERAGILSIWFGEEAVEFTRFLRAKVPETSIVVVMTDTGAGEYRFPNLMQYYLFPREVRGCNTRNFSECLAETDALETAIIRVGPLPPAELVPSDFEYHPFDESLGVYLLGSTQ
jgi:hypothetical protein